MSDALLKLISIVLVVMALVWLAGGAGDAGVFGTLFHWAAGIFLIATAVGFWRYRGWAFLVVSAGLLVGWLTMFIGIVLAADQGRSVWPSLVSLLVIMSAMGFLGRWSMEKRFRPHLDVDH